MIAEAENVGTTKSPARSIALAALLIALGNIASRLLGLGRARGPVDPPLDELQLRIQAPVREQPDALTEDDGDDDQLQLVDQDGRERLHPLNGFTAADRIEHLG